MLGLVAWRLGDQRRAATLLTEGLTQAWQVGDREWIGVALNYLASLACDQQRLSAGGAAAGGDRGLWAKLS